MSSLTQPELITHATKASSVVFPVSEEFQISVLAPEENLMDVDEKSAQLHCGAQVKTASLPSSLHHLWSCRSKPEWIGSPPLQYKYCKGQRSSLHSSKSEHSPAAMHTSVQLKPQSKKHNFKDHK